MRPISVANPPRNPPTPTTTAHQGIGTWNSTYTSISSGPPTTASQANFVVTSASGSGGGSGGTKWPSSSSSSGASKSRGPTTGARTTKARGITGIPLLSGTSATSSGESSSGRSSAAGQPPSPSVGSAP